MQLTITVKEGATNVEIAHALRFQANLIEGLPAKMAAKLTARPDEGQPDEESPKPTKKAPEPAAEEDNDDFVTETATNGFDDEAADEEPAEEEKPAKSAKSAKANGKVKKATLDDVNDACKAHARVKGRATTLSILQKKFKTESVTALKPEQYEACISAMAVN